VRGSHRMVRTWSAKNQARRGFVVSPAANSSRHEYLFRGPDVDGSIGLSRAIANAFA
jgi:hypothetical protein